MKPSHIPDKGEYDRVPLSFRSTRERKLAPPKLDQLALCVEPDDQAEFAARKSFDTKRGPTRRGAPRSGMRCDVGTREEREGNPE